MHFTQMSLHASRVEQLQADAALNLPLTTRCKPTCSSASLLTSFLVISPLVIAFFICSIALVILHTVLCCHHHPSSCSSALTGILVHLLLLGGWLRLDWNILLDLVIFFHCLLGGHWRSRGRRRRGPWTFYGRCARRGVGRGGVRRGCLLGVLTRTSTGGKG